MSTANESAANESTAIESTAIESTAIESTVDESTVISSEVAKGSRASTYISWTASALIILVAISYVGFGYVINECVKIGHERSALVEMYEAKSRLGSQIFSFLANEGIDLNPLQSSINSVSSSINRTAALRPAIVKNVPSFAQASSKFLAANQQLTRANTPVQRQEHINKIIQLNNDLNLEGAELNKNINIALSKLAQNFYYLLALAAFSFILLAYLNTLMRTTIARISAFPSQIIKKLSEGPVTDLSVKESISDSKLLPGADLLVGETVKLAEMYRGAIVKERQLFDDQKILSDKFEATNIELIAAREETFRAAQLSAIGKVAGSVSHEINNPITGILGYIAYVRKKSTDPDLVKYLEKAQKEVERIGRIAKSLLVFSRHNVALPSSKFDLASSVENVAVLTGPQLHISLVEIDVAPLGDLPSVVGRVDEFQQCLLNMVLNARDALKDSEERKIWISGRVTGEKIELLITDSGSGVPEKFREFLFQPFHTTKPAGEGSGLGLSVCRELMARMGGAADFDPTYGPGARFILSLPIYTEPEVTTQSPTAV